MQTARIAAAALALAALASCAPRQQRPEPEPQPQQRPEPVRPAPEPEPAPADWRDAPLTPGDWSYAGSGTGASASYGPAGEAGFIVRCTAAGQISFARRAAAGAANALTLRTTSGARSFAARSEGGALVATLPASDPFLDALVFSRGRFTVEAAGLPTLILPAWPEPARVIEECRS